MADPIPTDAEIELAKKLAERYFGSRGNHFLVTGTAIVLATHGAACAAEARVKALAERETQYAAACKSIDVLTEALLDTQSRLEAALSRLQAWHECALYDAKMSGPVFKGWDRSALDRCRRESEDLAVMKDTEHD